MLDHCRLAKLDGEVEPGDASIRRRIDWHAAGQQIVDHRDSIIRRSERQCFAQNLSVVVDRRRPFGSANVRLNRPVVPGGLEEYSVIGHPLGDEFKLSGCRCEPQARTVQAVLNEHIGRRR